MVIINELNFLWIGVLLGSFIFLQFYIKAWRKSKQIIVVKLIYGFLMVFSNAILLISWLFEISIVLVLIFYSIFEIVCILVMYAHLSENLELNSRYIQNYFIYSLSILLLIFAFIFLIILELTFISNRLDLIPNWALPLGLFFLGTVILGAISIIRMGKITDTGEYNAEFESGPKYFGAIVILGFGFILILLSFTNFYYVYDALNKDIVSIYFDPFNFILFGIINLILGFTGAIPSLLFLIKERKKRIEWIEKKRRY